MIRIKKSEVMILDIVGFITHPAFWLITGLILIILEVTTLTFILLWIGIGAMVAGISAFIIPSIGMQLLVFSITSLLLLIYTRPLTRRWRNKTPNIQSGVYALIGKEGIVVDEITELSSGTVKVGGEIWTATGDTTLQVGDVIEIIGVEGVTLQVKSKEG